jgi:hypothetical protein
MEDLSAFLSRGEIQDIISAYIDDRDRQLIAAIAALDEPVPGDLESFFAGEYSYLDLYGMLLNLEERLILYRFQEEGVYHLALNPLLEPVLAPVIADKGALFPSWVLENEDASPEPAHPYWDERSLAAFFAFVAEEPDFFKAEGGIRKKVLDGGQQIFPGRALDPLIGGLQSLGLLQVEGSRLVQDDQQLNFFRDLSTQDRREYLAAGIYNYLQGKDPVVRYFNRGRIRILSRFIHRVSGALDTGRRYPRKTLKRILGILEREDAGNFQAAELGMPPPVIGDTGADLFLDSLESAGLLRAAQGNAADSWYFAAAREPGTGRPVIAMDTAFSCILYPEIAFADALILASFCSARETGTTVRFEVGRESVVRGLDHGLQAEAMIGHLERLSGSPADQNLRWTLTDWGSRYSSVSLYQGTVLTLAEDRQYLSQAEPLASRIVRTLATGVYLLSVENAEEAVLALQKAGVDIIARPPLSGRAGEAMPPAMPLVAPPAMLAHSPYPSLGGLVRAPEGDFRERVFEERAPASPATGDGAAYLERFRKALIKAALPKNERDELAARIERRLILSESQLAGAAVRYEKMEARNLDYVGKTMLAKQAIMQKSLVEISWPNPDGGLSRAAGIPRALEKSGAETLLILNPVAAEDTSTSSREDIRIPLGKISLLRRIKKSIFGE